MGSRVMLGVLLGRESTSRDCLNSALSWRLFALVCPRMMSSNVFLFQLTVTSFLCEHDGVEVHLESADRWTFNK